MSASPRDSVTSFSQPPSDKSITAETVSDTVMAEQISHNVVDNTESTSAQPLVDVTATQTTFASADAGTYEHPLETKNDSVQTSQLANELAADNNALTSSALAQMHTTDHVADPSAGDAADEVAQAPTAALESTLSEQISQDSQLLNGGHIPANAVDGNVEDANSVDVSVNSDTEGSRGDASELKKDEKHHNRTNSVKKPSGFAKVSITKSYLAKSATAAPVPAKAGEKPSPVGTPPQNAGSRPRLIAKTGASLRDVQKTRLGSDSAGGPDASKVWNKNQPVAPPPPKQFTDEELKQQYGIHLATRLQTDENGKESKWADIDDDEDDWAPETVVWMDGTKSTLTPHDAVPLPTEQKPASPSPPKQADGIKQPTLAVRKPTELGPTKTILKPGAIAAAVQARQSGSPSGTPAEKSSLKAKSPAPAPSKSPWAPLPPVDKISPINPPVQQPQPPPFATQDARAYEQALPPPPAREIAADTFDRSWHEAEGGPRELFNSANGRYEPVTEGRRSSIKPDSSLRKPAVLQRQGVGAAAPAEPSAAFQTRSTSQADAPWARRRGSSVSQGSIPPARRMSITKGQEMSPVSDRRPSTVVGHDLRSSPRMARTEPAQPMFSQQSAWQQQMPPMPAEAVPAAPEEDPVKVQERIMKEKRELAKKRRQEEEERLEKEKQERLKARLAQLEGAGKSRKEREAEAAAAKATEAPSSEKPSEAPLPPPTMEEPHAQPAKPAEMSAMTAPALEAQSLPSAPEAAQAQQASLEEIMPSPLPPKPQAQQQQLAGVPDRTNISAEQTQRQQSRPNLSPRAHARAPFQQPSAAYRAPASSYSSPGDRKPQPHGFGPSPLPNTGGFSPWPSTAPTGNVWGTSGIGNGTFSSASVFAPMETSQQNSSLPPPPGMGRPTSARISPQSLAHESRSPSLQQQSVPEGHRGFAPPGFEARPDPFANHVRANGPSPGAAPGLGRPAHGPGPIAPPSRAPQQPTAQVSEQAAKWRTAAHDLPAQYFAEAEEAERKRSDAAPTAPRDETIRETFKMTSSTQGRLGAPRKFDKTEYTVHDSQGSRSVQSLSPAPPNAQTQPSGPFSATSPLQQETWKPANESTVRIPDGSLNPAHGGMASPQPPIAPPGAQYGSVPRTAGQVYYPTAPVESEVSTMDRSPPPPETSSHPVNSGDASHPLVKLPPGKPKPVVKLPPAPAQPQQYAPPPKPTMMPQRPISNVGAPLSARPIAASEVWQMRFNGLFNRTPIQTETPPSPPKTPPKMQGPALAVTSSSRVVMDEMPTITGATVSLPQAKAASEWSGFTVDDSDDVVSKPTIEQMFTEELSFGSKPQVSVPRKVAYHNGVYEGAPTAMMHPNPNPLAPGDGQSKDIFQLTEVHPRRSEGVFVSIPQTKLVRKLVRRQHGGRKPSGMFQERKPSGKFPRGKGKETTTPAPTTSGPSGATSRKPSTQNGAPPTAASTTAATGSSPAADGGKRSAPPKRAPRKLHAPQAPQPVKSV